MKYQFLPLNTLKFIKTFTTVCLKKKAKKDATHDEFIAEFSEDKPLIACVNIKYDTNEVPVRHVNKLFLVKWCPGKVPPK